MESRQTVLAHSQPREGIYILPLLLALRQNDQLWRLRGACARRNLYCGHGVKGEHWLAFFNYVRPERLLACFLVFSLSAWRGEDNLQKCRSQRERSRFRARRTNEAVQVNIWIFSPLEVKDFNGVLAHLKHFKQMYLLSYRSLGFELENPSSNPSSATN